MSDKPDWFESGRPHVWLPYTQMKTAPAPLPVVKTEGVRITLADGRELIDGIASWWSAAHGYNHPHIISAVEAQLRDMPHVMFGGLVNKPALQLSERLAKLLPGDLNHCFIAESGSVSVEVAMKMAVQYFLNRGENRHKFVHFRGGYHGDTFGTMAVCDPDEGMHSQFGPMLKHHLPADLPRDEKSAAAFAEDLASNPHVAGVIFEPLVQGAGGMVFHGPETLKWLRAACDAAGVLLIADEIFTGFYRTGHMFACNEAGIVPDIVTLSKALSGGVSPLSVAVARSHVYDAFLDDDPAKALMHGPTYMGHALGCAAANASLDLFERDDYGAKVAAIADQLKHELEPCRALANVKDVRVKGAIGVVQLKDASGTQKLRPQFIEAGVWIRPFGDIVYLAPSLTIGSGDLSRLTGAIRTVLAAA